LNSIASRVLREGKTSLLVPELLEPRKYPSFFNPRGKLVRDVSLACYESYARTFRSGGESQRLSFADCLSGTGARGIRVANELPMLFDRIFLNDISPTSIELAKRSAIENGVQDRCFISQEESCAFLLTRTLNQGERFDVVDVDPFGTPSPYIDCAIRAVTHGGMLSVSATDTAVLCGVYPKVAQRKYLGLPLRTDYSHEIGLRLIFGLLSMTAMRMEASITPLFCHHDMHYFRAYCLVDIGNAFSRQNELEIGYVLHCFKCSYRKISRRDEFLTDMGANLKCPNCSQSSLKIGGPLWAGNIQSRDFIAKCAEISELSLFEEESDIPLYYDLTELADSMQIRTPKIADIMSSLETGGHLATRTRLNRNAIRTDAPLQEIRAALAQLSH